ncbi:MAG: GHKL domain-containing protein [Ruminococcus sp.]|nr:GHKL domain-containing protein [Ruminococcus sp.]
MIDFLWKLLEFAVTIFDGFVLTRFVFLSLNCNLQYPTNKAKYFISSIGYAIVISIMNSITVFEGLGGVIYTVYAFLISLFLLQGTVIKKLFVSILNNLIALFVNVLVSSAVSAAFKADITVIYTEQSLIRFIAVISAQILMFVFCDLLIKIIGQDKLSLNKKEWFLILITFVFSFSTIAIIHIAQTYYDIPEAATMLMLFAEICSVILFVASFYIIFALSKSNKESEELRILKQQNEYRIQYANNIKMQYDEIRRIRHDMKQSYSVIESLISDEKYAEASEYINSNISSIGKSEIIINVGNDFVNAILNSKLTYAKSIGIEVICSSTSNIKGIDDTDLCSLLGNMLDNAIEACEKNEGEKLIETNIIFRENKYIIIVSNSVESEILKSNKALKTTKKDTENHGFGVKSIRTIAEKYGGVVNYYQERNMFNCQVVLMLK